MKNNKPPIQTIFYTQGMHCAACEILIEKKLIKEPSVDMVDAHLSQNTVVVEHRKGDKINPSYLNNLFLDDGYKFSYQPFKKSLPVNYNSSCDAPTSSSNLYRTLFIAFVLIVGFVLLNKTGFTSLISVNANTALPVFFVFGLLAGFSSCAALVGGIILSVSKQWIGLYGNNDDTVKKLEPHLLFNAGRVGGYILFGAILGLVGNFFKLSPLFTALMVIAVSAVMVLLGLQMLGVKALAKFQFKLPKFITGKVADESNFQGRFAPALMGALTFFLPCGFTVTAQALALASSNPVQGALIMGLFALGTIPGLLAIGFSSVKMYSNPKLSGQFTTIAGILVLFFALFNVNSQLNVLGLPNLTDVLATSNNASTSITLPPMINGIQVVKIEASSAGYTPNRIKMRANTPSRWEVAASNISGCTNAIISNSLFTGQIDLVDGQVSIKEFTTPKAGVYKFSCWMGMVSGVVEVVDSSGSTGTSPDTQPVASGAKGCGCGGGGSSCGSR